MDGLGDCFQLSAESHKTASFSDRCHRYSGQGGLANASSAYVIESCCRGWEFVLLGLGRKAAKVAVSR